MGRFIPGDSEIERKEVFVDPARCGEVLLPQEPHPNQARGFSFTNEDCPLASLHAYLRFYANEAHPKRKAYRSSQVPFLSYLRFYRSSPFQAYSSGRASENLERSEEGVIATS